MTGAAKPQRSSARNGGKLIRARSAGAPAPTIELRLADSSEAGAVRLLAELDSAPELNGPVVIALIDGDAVAGLSLLDQRVVANPFIPTCDAVALLRLRAKHLSSVPADRRRRRVLGVRSA